MFIIAFILSQSSGPNAGVDPEWRDEVFADIHAYVETHQPSLWGEHETEYFVELSWDHANLSAPLRYHRSVVRAYHQLTLVETWTFDPGDLPQVGLLFGHSAWLTWENILGDIADGRIIVTPNHGEILILRDFPPNQQPWRQHPFDLAYLPTVDGNAQPQPQWGAFGDSDKSKLASFLNDVFTEELLDRDGLTISISKSWNFVDNFSRLSPFLRINRSVRLDFSGRFTVFDIYSFGGEFLLGSNEGIESGTHIETGALLTLDKSIAVVRSGYDKWYQAVFAQPVHPKKFPLTKESVKELPIGVRFIFPFSTGLALAERARHDTTWSDRVFPLQLKMYLGLKGNFFISLVRRNSDQLDLRFGGKIERFGEADFRARPKYEDVWDPLRLVTGTYLQLRGKITDGTKLILEKSIDLNDPQQVAEVPKVLRRGVRFNGIGLGIAGIINFSFLNRFDTYLVHQFIAGKLPELSWEHQTVSHFRVKEHYAKAGIRFFSARTRGFRLLDDWETEQLIGESGMQKGRSISHQKTSTLRWFSHIDQRKTHLRGIMAETGQFLEIADTYNESKMSIKEYQKIQSRLMDSLGTSSDFNLESEWIEPFKKCSLGYRLLLTPEALFHMADQIRHGSYSEEVGLWLRRHPILKRRVLKAKAASKDEFAAVSHLLFRLTREHGPLMNWCETIPSPTFHLEWRAVAPGQPFQKEVVGTGRLSQQQIQSWQRWELLSVLDDIFIDNSFVTY